MLNDSRVEVYIYYIVWYSIASATRICLRIAMHTPSYNHSWNQE